MNLPPWLLGPAARLLRHLPGLYPWLRDRYRRLAGRALPLERELAQRLRGPGSLYFVQVGSNDGAQGDPIQRLIRRHRQWQGLFIEPVPRIFERLKANYGEDPRFQFANVAIGAERGEAAFYTVSEQAKAALGEELPYWWDQLGSFDRGHILKHLEGRLAPYIVEMRLPCLPLPALLDDLGVQRVDLLHIDTEGYDYQVLAQFDFQRHQPQLVLYEHQHLSAAERQLAAQLMQRQGYRLIPYLRDTLAVRDPA